jgi:hypothetical protein
MDQLLRTMLALLVLDATTPSALHVGGPYSSRRYTYASEKSNLQKSKFRV